MNEPQVWRIQRLCHNCGQPEHFGSAYCKRDDPPAPIPALNLVQEVNNLCTVCGEPRPCPAAQEISEPAIWVGTPPTPSEKEQHNGK